MKTKQLLSTFPLLILFSSLATAAPLGTAFTYQGQLTDGGSPANGSYDLTFILYDAATNGAQWGSPANVEDCVVSNGLLTVELDFGLSPLNGDARWLLIGVRPGASTGNYAYLQPRQALRPAPYALRAANIASTALAGEYGSAVVFTNLGNSFIGSFTGSGANLTALNASQLTSGTVSPARGGLGFDASGTQAGSVLVASGLGQWSTLPPGAEGQVLKLSQGVPAWGSGNSNWRTDGNADTVAGTHFLGTTDNQPLELKVNNCRGWRLEATVNDANHSNIVNVVGGSPANVVKLGVHGAVIGGGGAGNYFGLPRINRVDADFGTLGGGWGNAIQANAGAATIGGGSLNTIQTNAYSSMIGGGYANTIQTYADSATIGGGWGNAIQANALAATIGGGVGNTIQTNASYATIPGGRYNSATNYAFAAGHRAKANHTGTFVWADSTDTDFASTGVNQFLIRASGGVGVGTASPGHLTHLMGNSPSLMIEDAGTGPAYLRFNRLSQPDTTYIALGSNNKLFFKVGGVDRMVIATNGYVGIGTDSPTNKLHVDGGVSATAFVSTSDRNAKENFVPVNAGEVLDKVAALPIARWNFKDLHDGEHMGPMAQDFRAAFGLGNTDTGIATVDADGVALSAIQGLNQKLESGKQKAEIRSQRTEDRVQKLESENAELKARLEKLEQLLIDKLIGGAK